MRRFLLEIPQDLLILLALSLAGWKFVYGLENLIDIGFSDETYYLAQGVNLLTRSLSTADYAPLYAIWYFLLSILQPDRVKLYFLNYELMTILPVLLLYILLRKQDAPRLASAALALMLLIGSINLKVWPKVGHFSLIVVLLSYILASRWRTNFIISLSILALGALLASYSRPELFLVFLLMAFVLGTAIFVRRDQVTAREKAALLGCVAIAVTLILMLGNPLGNSSRSQIAFGQHFAVNWVSWTHSDLDPMIDWQQIVRRNFGDTPTPIRALTENPSAFFHHVESNTVHLPEIATKLFFGHAPIFLPEDLWQVEAFVWLVVFIAALILLGRRELPAMKERIQDRRVILFSVGCYLGVSLLVALIIFPRSHYLILPVTLATIALACLLLKSEEEKPFPLSQLALVGLLIIALTPRATFYYPPNKKRPISQTLTAIRTLAIPADKQIFILDATQGYCVYLAEPCKEIAIREKNVPCDQFLIETRANLIILDQALRDDLAFKLDPQCPEFVKKLEEHSFSSFPVPANDIRLLVSDQLLR